MTFDSQIVSPKFICAARGQRGADVGPVWQTAIRLDLHQRTISNEESSVTVSTRCFVRRSMIWIGNALAGAHQLNWLAVVRLILQVVQAAPSISMAIKASVFWNLEAVRPDQHRLSHFSEARTAKFTIKKFKKSGHDLSRRHAVPRPIPCHQEQRAIRAIHLLLPDWLISKLECRFGVRCSGAQ